MRKYIYPAIVITALFLPVLRWITALLFVGIILHNAWADIKKKFAKTVLP